MSKLLQSVSLLLVLLLLATPATAITRCQHCTHAPEMEMCCCAGMHGNSMPMSEGAHNASSCAQLVSAACCTTTQTDLSTPATLSDWLALNDMLLSAPVVAIEPIQTSTDPHRFDEYPPGARPVRAALTRLCAFLI